MKLHGQLDSGDQTWHSATQRCTQTRAGRCTVDSSTALYRNRVHRHVAHLTINVLAGMSELKDRVELLL